MKDFSGLIAGKRATLVFVYGANGYTDGPMKSADFMAPYLTFTLNFIGISEVTIVPVEGMNAGKADQAEARARAAIATIEPNKCAA